ncbi:DNA-deoxyinosine glycosylase [Mycoavidus sp. SF9855]|uniref:DNA-deoxyinosine glycosylase n=1 Tax=Mycoavidus sp. SF9855 TaxID=2968475 RepID=UPI00211BD48C|nr:DNA-deoxyinosine glycosylase [Mycoavidus sp. SF9855]UUM21997.1 DNA-deoxyinosine glycosylase [Mycoavidus sp. SF9855]
MLYGFPPVLANDTRILILGSFPGEASLLATQYYAHPRNQFWRLLSELLNEPLTELTYPARLERLLTYRIGLWDVLAACQRKGSLDTAIRQAAPNDFAGLQQLAPALEKICFNGKTAGRFAPVLCAAGYQTLALPSSSPAYAALSFEQKLRAWREILHDNF